MSFAQVYAGSYQPPVGFDREAMAATELHGAHERAVMHRVAA